MSRPLAQMLRPVKMLRAAPTAKCASMLTVSDTQIAAPDGRVRNGTSGITAPTAVARAGHQAVGERGHRRAA